MMAQNVQMPNDVSIKFGFAKNVQTGSSDGSFDIFLGQAGKTLFAGNNVNSSENISPKNEMKKEDIKTNFTGEKEALKSETKSDSESKSDVLKTENKETDSLTNTAKAEESNDIPSEEVIEKVGTLLADVKDVIVQMLGIGEEELTVKMEELGLSDLDLLNPDSLKELFMAFKPGKEMSDLLTDPELLEQLTNLQEKITDIYEASGIDKNTFESAFALALNGANKSEEKPVDAQKSEDVKTFTDEDRKNDVSLKSKGKNDEGNVKETTIDFKTAADSDAKSKASTDEKQDFTAAPAEQFLNNLTDSMKEVSGVEGTELTAQIREIANQILDKIKVNITEASTSLEMLIKPEHLGRVSLTVTQENGVMKAKFVTENELSKEAIESNLVQFKQQLSEQGLKVDSIEVTVSDFKFRNDEETGKNDQSDEKKSKKKFSFDEESTEDVSASNNTFAYIDDGNSTVNYVA
ncbi:MAG: flagellar hook-length control protein FliK [Lachnospiraceae bacterium]|nr:flagellar hook-length control protein FliK [Lachnospiraceae bacterium]